jgi:hypothetical protein
MSPRILRRSLRDRRGHIGHAEASRMHILHSTQKHDVALHHNDSGLTAVAMCAREVPRLGVTHSPSGPSATHSPRDTQSRRARRDTVQGPARHTVQGPSRWKLTQSRSAQVNDTMKSHNKTTQRRFLRCIEISVGAIPVLLLPFVATSTASASETVSVEGTAFCKTPDVHPCNSAWVIFKGVTRTATPNKEEDKGRFKVEGVPAGSQGEKFEVWTELQDFQSVQCKALYTIIREGNGYDIGNEPWPKNQPCATWTD